MINYETAPSPFFTANKNHCEEIEKQFLLLNAECSGFCNSFGYEIETTVNRGATSWHFKFIKDQHTRNGVIIPVNAQDVISSTIAIKGLNPSLTLSVGRSSLKRLFMKQELKKAIAPPFFISYNNSFNATRIPDIIEQVVQNKIYHLKIANGNGVLKMNGPLLLNATEFINKMEAAITN